MEKETKLQFVLYEIQVQKQKLIEAYLSQCCGGLVECRIIQWKVEYCMDYDYCKKTWINTTWNGWNRHYSRAEKITNVLYKGRDTVVTRRNKMKLTSLWNTSMRLYGKCYDSEQRENGSLVYRWVTGPLNWGDIYKCMLSTSLFC